MGRPRLPDAPSEYHQQAFAQLINALDTYFATLDNPGAAVFSTLRLLNVPGSGNGLPAGSVWSDAGVLKLVLPGTGYAKGAQGTGKIGTVTIVIV
jgi:hypothetical protein